MKIGIYKIRNKINGKIYIGKSVNLQSRKNSHFYLLRKQKHGNIHLQRSFNKYGAENFEFSIIEIVNEEFLNEKEIYYIKELKPEYNIMKEADNKLRMAQSSKDKLSKFQIRYQKAKAVYSKNLITGNVIKHSCLMSTSKELNIFLRNIQSVLKGKRNSCNNYTFSYDLKFPTNKQSDKLKKEIYLYNIDNQFIRKYPSQKQCSEDLNISYGFLHRLINSSKSYKNIYYFRSH